MQIVADIAAFQKWAYVFGMSPKALNSHRVGYVRDDKRRRVRTQRDMLADAGVTRVYEDWALLIRQRRPGTQDVVVVSDLWVIADPRARTVKGGMRQSLMARRAELRKAGASIVELSSGRSTTDAVEADAMLADALDVLANTRSRSARIGRPPKSYTPDQQTVMRLHWHSRQHVTNRAALAAMAADGVRVSVQMATRLLGPSGRKPGTTGPRPAKKAPKRGVNR